jgi:hypothetical protein
MFIEVYFVGDFISNSNVMKTHRFHQQGFMYKYNKGYIYVYSICSSQKNKFLNNLSWTVTVRRRNKIKRKLATICIIMATFFNPAGFDALFALIMRWTNSYWTTDLIFYCLSLFFFGLYFWLSPTAKRGLTNLKKKLHNFLK